MSDDLYPDLPHVRDRMIRISELHKAFGEGDRRIPVLQGVDLALDPGEFVALLGRSGSGKSTLLNIVGGLEIPDAGAVSIDGTELTSLDDRRRTIFRRDRIGIVFQFFNLLPVLSVLNNVTLPALLAGRGRQDVERRGRELLALVGMESRIDAHPDELSGGEQQRVATARALINSPAVILADEPTGNLDSDNSERILELLAKLAQEEGQTVLMATHDEAAAGRARRTVLLEEGRIVARGATGTGGRASAPSQTPEPELQARVWEP
jgi:putative ABC transport system ATP-binding protein